MNSASIVGDANPWIHHDVHVDGLTVCLTADKGQLDDAVAGCGDAGRFKVEGQDLFTVEEVLSHEK